MSEKIQLSSEMKYNLLRQITFIIRNTLDLDEVLNNLLNTLENVLEFDACGIFILSDDISSHPNYNFSKQYIAGIAKRGYDDNPPENDEMLSSGKGLVGYVIRTGESLVIPDVKLDERYVIGRQNTASEIVVPIVKDNKVIGALDVESDKLAAFDSRVLEILNFFAEAASISIESAMLHNQILQKKKIEKQLQIASEVQSRLLPHKSPEINGYDFAGICIPSYEIGGDYFDYILLDENKIGIVIADVSGNGIPAALIMTAFRALIRSQSKHFSSTSEIMKMINSQLFEFTRKKDFVTAFFSILDFQNHTLSYTNCGHNPPILFKYGGKAEFLDIGGPALTLMNDANFKSGNININERDVLVLYTDGVTEIFNKKADEFGLEGLIQVINNNIEFQSDEILENIINATDRFLNSTYYKDDYTAVVLKRNPDSLSTSKEIIRELVNIIDYEDNLKVYFKRLNLEWINKYFRIEAIDELLLDDPRKQIIEKGGFVLFAKYKDTVCGTVAVIKKNDGVFEMAKMAVNEKYQGLGIGKMLAVRVIEKVKELRARKLILETNWNLVRAIELYRKLGFTETPYNSNETIKYSRPTFKMELNFI